MEQKDQQLQTVLLPSLWALETSSHNSEAAEVGLVWIKEELVGKHGVDWSFHAGAAHCLRRQALSAAISNITIIIRSSKLDDKDDINTTRSRDRRLKDEP